MCQDLVVVDILKLETPSDATKKQISPGNRIEVGHIEIASDDDGLSLLKSFDVRTQILVPVIDAVAQSVQCLACERTR